MYQVTPNKTGNNYAIESQSKGYSVILETTAPQWYGVSGLESEDVELTRIGTMVFHASLPVHSLMKACLLLDDGSVNYYLDPDNWSLQFDGVTDSKLDGTDGQVMIEIPEHYFRDWIDESTQKTAVSLTNESGFTKSNKMYVGAYQATCQRSTEKLASVKNVTTDYRGGDNDAANDSLDNTYLGKCMSNLPIQAIPTQSGNDFRSYAANRGSGWYAMTWKARAAIQRLFVIEYATKESQTAVDNSLTTEGYKKGGLGMGATEADAGQLIAFNDRHPFIPIGVSDELGNGSGEVNYTTLFTIPDEMVVCRYRGIENVFGHNMELIEGVVMKFDHIERRIEVYLIDDSDNFTSDDETNGRFIGYIEESHGTISQISIGDFFPLAISGTDFTKYFCDRGHFTLANEAFEYLHVRTCGYATTSTDENSNGLFWMKSEDVFSLTYNYIGSRLNYISEY